MAADRLGRRRWRRKVISIVTGVQLRRAIEAGCFFSRVAQDDLPLPADGPDADQLIPFIRVVSPVLSSGVRIRSELIPSRRPDWIVRPLVLFVVIDQGEDRI